MDYFQVSMLLSHASNGLYKTNGELQSHTSHGLTASIASHLVLHFGAVARAADNLCDKQVTTPLPFVLLSPRIRYASVLPPQQTYLKLTSNLPPEQRKSKFRREAQKGKNLMTLAHRIHISSSPISRLVRIFSSFSLLGLKISRNFAPDLKMWTDLGCLQPQKKMLKRQVSTMQKCPKA